MDDVTCGESILGQLTELYRSMYNTCRKDSVILPLCKDHLKFRVLCGQRRKKGVFHGRRIAPLYPNRTVKSCQAKLSHFGRKSKSQVTEMTITHMLAGKDGNDNDNETPMEVSENEDDIVPFVEIQYLPGKHISIFCHHLFNICHMLLLSHLVKKKPGKRSLIWFVLSYSLFWLCLFICFFLGVGNYKLVILKSSWNI